MKNHSKFITISFVFLNIALLIISNFSLPFLDNIKIQYVPIGVAVGQSLQEQLDELNRQIEEVKREKEGLQSQLDQNSYIINGYSSELSALYGEVELYNKQIQEIDLEIKQLELKIDNLNKDIEKQKADIAQTENTIVGLEEESESRIKDNYFNFRLYRSTDDASTVFNLTNINAFFKTSQYKELIQADTNDVMVELAELKQQLQDKKQVLSEQLIEVNKDKEIVDVKKSDLAKKKEEADIKITAYQNELNNLQAQSNAAQTRLFEFDDQQAKMQAEANRVQQEIFNSYVPTDDGQYVVSGTYIGKQGCTGLCTGAHLHFMVYINNQLQNPCGYLKDGIVDGCGGGYLDAPLQGSILFTSGFGNRCFWWGDTYYCDFHTGIDIIGSPWNAPIFAAHDGYVHKFWDDGYGAQYIILCQNRDCSGLKTGYWHLSEF
ncbi:MAG: hypothetical protein IAE91_06385 [Ignavibacteriaceae bacterium]|nr:hypothetical protein [Ignavibacteriaceae bacterium]